MPEPVHVKIRFTDAETGWAEQLDAEAELYRLDNIPMTGEMCIDDVVVARDIPHDPDDDPIPVVVRVIHPLCRYDGKIAFRYGLADTYPKVFNAAVERGWKVEGVIGPTDHRQEIALMCYTGKMSDAVNFLNAQGARPVVVGAFL